MDNFGNSRAHPFDTKEYEEDYIPERLENSAFNPEHNIKYKQNTLNMEHIIKNIWETYGKLKKTYGKHMETHKEKQMENIWSTLWNTLEKHLFLFQVAINKSSQV